MKRVTDGECCSCTMYVDVAEGLLTTPLTYELRLNQNEYGGVLGKVRAVCDLNSMICQVRLKVFEAALVIA